MNRSKAWLNTRDSFWFMPAVYSVITFILVILISLTNTWIVSLLKDTFLEDFIVGKDTARKLYSTLVTAILTMTTLSFSVIMVVLTTYATEFSPRILQNFMKSKFTQHVLGIYCSGFIYALLLLVLVDYNEPFIGPIVMVILTLFTLGAFVYFIHHASRFLQINNIISLLKNEGSNAIEAIYNQDQSFIGYSEWEEKEILDLVTKEKTILKSKHSGYVQNINWEGIIAWAKKNNSVVELHVEAGSFIPKHLPYMTIMSDEKVEPKLHSYITIGNERSDIQDFEFTIQKLEEIALRAISSSTNDPHTVVNCMNRLGLLLTELGEVQKYSPYIADKNNQLRIVHQPTTFDEYLYKSFYEIRYYGQHDVSVMYNMINVLYKIAVVSEPIIKEKVWNFHFYVMEVIEWDKLSKLDRDYIEGAYNNLKSSCEEVRA